MEPSSFKNVKNKWIPEIRHHSNDDIKIILVGTKADLRDDPHTLDRLEESGNEPISKTDANRLVKELGLFGYVECSAATQDGVENVFETAIKSVIQSEAEILPPKSTIANNMNANDQSSSGRPIKNVQRATISTSRKIRKKSKCTIL